MLEKTIVIQTRDDRGYPSKETLTAKLEGCSFLSTAIWINGECYQLSRKSSGKVFRLRKY